MSIAIAASACLNNPPAPPAPCELSASDSTFAAGLPLYRDCSVEEPARVTGRLPFPNDWRPTAVGQRCYSTTINFVVDANGNPEMATARIVKSNDGSWANAILNLVPALHYQPAKKGGVAVRQLVTYERATTVLISTDGKRPTGTTSP